MKKFTFSFSLLILLTGFSFFKPQPSQAAGLVPPAPQGVVAKKGLHPGEVILYWDQVPYANRYAIVYGPESGKYLYGANNIGGEGSRSYTVKFLKPGVKYYFRLAAIHDDSSSPFSSEVSAWAREGQVETGIKKGTVSSEKRVEVAKPAVVSQGVGRQHLTARPGAKPGEVVLTWEHADSADNYHLIYGVKPGVYQYGALNIGRVNRFTVRFLAPGRTYYFALVPLFNNQPLYTTPYVSAVAKEAVEVVETTKEALIQPKSSLKEETKVPVGGLEKVSEVKKESESQESLAPSPEVTKEAPETTQSGKAE